MVTTGEITCELLDDSSESSMDDGNQKIQKSVFFSIYCSESSMDDGNAYHLRIQASDFRFRVLYGRW